MVADPDTVWLGLEYFVNEGEPLWRMSDAELVDLAAGELATIGVADRADLLDGCALRMAKAYPTYAGSYDRLGLVRDWVGTIPNLFLLGRNGQHRYNNQDHSMLTAMIAVDNIAAGREDDSNVWDVNIERVYQEG